MEETNKRIKEASAGAGSLFLAAALVIIPWSIFVAYLLLMMFVRYLIG